MITLEDIVSEVPGITLRSGNPDTPIEAISYDSRDADDHLLFVALRGERFDGHDFIDSAIASGASAVLVETGHSCDVPVPVLEADDTRRILGELGSFFYGEPSNELVVVGITGTNGKTTSSYLLESIFSEAGRSTGIIGTIEYRWPGKTVVAQNTTPDGLVLQRTLREMVDDGVEVLVIEVSSHGLQNGRVDGMSFDIALFTNLSWDHVDFHGSMDAYRKAKWSLFTTHLASSRDKPIAVVNTDNEEGKSLAEALLERSDLVLATHSLKDDACRGRDRHFQGRDLQIDLDGISMNVDEGKGAHFSISAPFPGRFNAENILGAVSVARMLEVSEDAVARGLAGASGIPGRMQRIGVDEPGPAVFVDFAHSPEALREILLALRPITEAELWVVFGAGGDRDHSKRAPMGAFAAEFADQIIVTTDNPRTEDPESIIDEIVAGIEDADIDSDKSASWSRQIDRRTAIFDAISRAGDDDVVLVAGKGHETYQEQNGRRTDFDDRAISREALRSRGDK